MVTVLVGQAVLAVNAALLAKQNLLLDKQNEIASHRGAYEAYYEMHHATDPGRRRHAFETVLMLGEHVFAGISLEGELEGSVPGVISLGPRRGQIHGVYGQPIIMLRLNKSGTYDFTGAQLSNLVISLQGPRSGLRLQRASLLNCAVVVSGSGQSVQLNGAHLEHVTIQGRADVLDFSNSHLSFCHVPASWSRAGFQGASVVATSFEEERRKDADAQATCGIERLSQGVVSLKGLRGLTGEQMRKLKEIGPELMEWWTPAE